jgi:hypothetical protein
MRVSIDKIKPNPFRDFSLDPIDPEQVGRLALSHDQIGQFGAIPVRPCPTEPGFFEQGSGHHNIAAMRQRGDTEVNVESRERSDREMVKLMQLENLTQRHNNAGAVADSLAAEVRIATREMLVGNGLNDAVHTVKTEAATRMAWLKEGPGVPRLYAGVNGFELKEAKEAKELPETVEVMTARNLRAALSTLKATGHVAKIMAEEFDRFDAERERLAAEEAEAERLRQIEEAEAAAAAERERLAAEKAAEAAKKARAEAVAAKDKADKERKEKAAKEAEAKATAAKKKADADAAEQVKRDAAAEKRKADIKASVQRRQTEAKIVHDKQVVPTTYDVRCVSVFNAPQQEAAFRQGVLSENGLRYIPKDQQYPLALQIKEKITEVEKKRGHIVGSVTVGAFVNDLLREAILRQSQINKDEEARRRLQETDEARIQRHWDTARKGLQQAVSALEKLFEEQHNWKYTHPFPVDPKFTAQMRGVSQRVDRFIKETTGL